MAEQFNNAPAPSRKEFDDLSAHLGSFGDLLWTNPSPNAAFAAQSITLDLSAYKAVLITFEEYAQTASRHIDETRVAMVGAFDTQSVICPYVDTSSNKLTGFSTRSFRVNTTSAVSFTDAYNQGEKNNGQCVPISIYGII